MNNVAGLPYSAKAHHSIVKKERHGFFFEVAWPRVRPAKSSEMRFRRERFAGSFPGNDPAMCCAANTEIFIFRNNITGPFKFVRIQGAFVDFVWGFFKLTDFSS